MPRTVRETWSMADGDVASIERLQGHSVAPRLIVLHGLEGGTHSPYARGLLHEAERRGWWADLVLWRTCDDRLVNDVMRSYHSGASDDADEVIAHIISGDQERSVYIIGVSLGGNVLLKWLGERGDDVPGSVRAAAAVSVPFDLAAAASKLERGFAKLYARFFLGTMRTKALAKAARFPEFPAPDLIRNVTTLREFDDLITAPIHGYRDADDYYTRSSSLQFIRRIRVPTLLLNAVDDPFLPAEVLDEVRAAAAANPVVSAVFPPRGGHVGFVSGVWPWRPRFWLEPFLLDWLEWHEKTASGGIFDASNVTE